MTAGRSVLHVAFPAHGGVARVVRDLAATQLELGWTVTVASPTGPLTRWLDPRVRQVRWHATRAPGPGVVGETARIGRIVRQTRPDIVHLHSSKAGLAGRLALRGRLPTVFQPHAWSFLATTGGMADAARRWERFGARWADVVVHVSAAERTAGERAGINPRRWALVANGVDLAQFEPRDRAAARQRLGLGPGPLAVCIGRICRQKGQDLLVGAWPRVTAAVPGGAALALVGRVEDPLPPLPAGVTVRAECDDPRDWYAAADVLVAPSRWEAGLPLVAREAMASKRCVIVSDLDVVHDDFPAGAGRLVRVDDAAAWIEAVRTRLTEPSLVESEAEAGRRHAMEHFDVGRVGAAMVEVYDRLLAERAQ